MDAGLLKKLFPASVWSGACVVLVDGSSTVKTTGADSLQTGGVKHYAPRITSGRIEADCSWFHADSNSLLMIQRTWTRHHTGEDKVQQTLLIVDASHVVGVEFDGVGQLEKLGVKAPPVPDKMLYAASTLVG